jgi:hypothetical protein
MKHTGNRAETLGKSMLAQAVMLGVIVLRETITLGTEKSVTAGSSSTGNYDDPLKVPQ